MREYRSLAHTRWDCKYHVVFIPKYRKKVIYGDLRAHLGEIFHELAGYRECRIEEGHLMGDHVHMCISIPPKYAVSKTVGYIKGKSAIAIARQFGKKVRNFKGENLGLSGSRNGNMPEIHQLVAVEPNFHAIEQYPVEWGQWVG